MSFSGKIQFTKTAAAQRQIDAAIRMLFANEDELANHTVASAALHILRDLAEQRGTMLAEIPVTGMIKTLRELGQPIPENVSLSDQDRDKLKKWVYGMENRAANFLKHAKIDSHRALDIGLVDNDWVLLQCVCHFKTLVNELTPEMYTFARWHLAVYPTFERDTLPRKENIKDESEQLHKLLRNEQLEAGGELLDIFRKAWPTR